MPSTRKALQELYVEADGLITASENWADVYRKAQKNLKAVIANESRFVLNMRSYFRNLSRRVGGMINWQGYHANMTPSEIVEFNSAIEDEVVVRLIFNNVLIATVRGAQAGEKIYSAPIGITAQDAAIQQIASEQVANLVGMSKNAEGKWIPNPKAQYNITETTRKEIQQSIQTSLQLHESFEEATVRIQKIIANPVRAEMIARTESVRGYQRGLVEWGKRAGAVSKTWQTAANPCPICEKVATEGTIPIGDEFSVGDPPAHVNCRCGLVINFDDGTSD